MSAKPRLVVAGASGFIGRAVCARLVEDYDVTVLTRSGAWARDHEDPRITRRRCDLFSRRQVEEALAGFEYAVYLVNNLVPSARLSQARCRDMDVLVADNFGRAAAHAGLRQIVHLGLLVPQGDVPLDLVESRQEVPRALGARGTPVTALRAGLVVGPGGALIQLVADLTTRMPFIVLPRWANGRKQPIALPDVVRAIARVLGDASTFGRSFDLGGPRVMEVHHLLRRAARVFDRRKPVVMVPFLPAALFRWWVRFQSPRSHPDLVRRTVSALRYDTVARDNEIQREILVGATPARMGLDRSADRRRRVVSPSPRRTHRSKDDADLHAKSRVRSIQRLLLPADRNAEWALEHYFEWLPGFFLHTVRILVDERGDVRFVTRFPKVDLLRLHRVVERCSPDRVVYRIDGGLLARVVASRTARLEFREVLDGDCVMAAIHDFEPTLPWHVYLATQAIVHLVAMKTYAWHLKRMRAAEASRDAELLADIRRGDGALR